jgi:hypothetical protein
VKLGRLFGRIGFVVGFLGPLSFYASPPSWLTYESHLLCPYCPYIDLIFAEWSDWVLLGLKVGLLCGLILAFIGFVIGYLISKLKDSARLAGTEQRGP